MSTIQMLTVQKNWCDFHLDDAVTVLRNVSLSTPSDDNMDPADTEQRAKERGLLTQQKS